MNRSEAHAFLDAVKDQRVAATESQIRQALLATGDLQRRVVKPVARSVYYHAAPPRPPETFGDRLKAAFHARTAHVLRGGA